MLSCGKSVIIEAFLLSLSSKKVSSDEEAVRTNVNVTELTR